MPTLLSPRDYLRIQEAARSLGVSEQTLRNWDRSGKLKAQRHPINGYRLYRAADLHEFLKNFESESPEAGAMQLPLGLAMHSGRQAGSSDYAAMPDAHWSAAVGLDPKHRPQRWDAPSSTVRRDWRKYPKRRTSLTRRARRTGDCRPRRSLYYRASRPMWSRSTASQTGRRLRRWEMQCPLRWRGQFFAA